MLPFFLIAHFLSLLGEQPADGYSYWYPVWINIAAIVYSLLGCWFTYHLLRLKRVNILNSLLVVTAILFGTNLFYYAEVEPAMSHAYSFFVVSWFLYTATRYFNDRRSGRLLLMAVLLGLIFLIRPVNVLVVLALPVLADNRGQLTDAVRGIFQQYKALILAIVLLVAVMGLQPLLYKLQVNRWWVYSYGEEGFNFSDPHFWDMLFSYRKGLFVYTPLTLLAIIAGLFNVKYTPWRVFTFLAFFVIITYVLSSWWQWYYGGSFSQRVYIEFFPLFALMLGTGLQSLQGVKRTLVIALMVLLTGFCQVQTYQYRYYDINWSDMNKEKYWEAFPIQL